MSIVQTHKETIQLQGWAYSRTVQLESSFPSTTPEQLIDEIIKTPFFIWKGDQFPNGETWTFQEADGSEKTYNNVKIHGEFNASLLNSKDFNIISQKEAIQNLEKFIQENTEDKTFIQKSINAFNSQSQNYNQFFLLKNKESLQGKLSITGVYSFFISIIAINKNNSKSFLFEFGQD